MATATTIVLSSPPRFLSANSTSEHLHSPHSDDLPTLDDIYGTPSGSVARSPGPFPDSKPLNNGFSTARSLLDSQVAQQAHFRPPPGAIRLGLAQRYRYNVSPSQGPSCSESVSKVKRATSGSEGRSSSACRAVQEQDRSHDSPKSRPKDESKINKVKSRQAEITNAKIVKPGKRDTNMSTKTKAEGVEPREQQGQYPAELDLTPSADPVVGREGPKILGATKRRRDWTPTKDSEGKTRSEVGNQATSPIAENVVEVSSYGESCKANLDIFGFQASTLSTSASTSVIPNQTSFTTKHRIQIVDAGSSRACAVEKSKRSVSPIKKPRTITGKATAPFMSNVSNDEPAGTLNDYFGAQPSIEPTEVSKPKGNSKGKSSSKKKRKQSPQVIVLSPESAMKKAQAQDIMFGTSSQLARDESPEYILDLQRALKASEEAAEDGPANPSVIQGTSKRLELAPSKRLWAAASRDLNEDLMQSEPIVKRPRTLSVAQTEQNNDKAKALPNPDTSFQDVDDIITDVERPKHAATRVAATPRPSESDLGANDTVVGDLQCETFADHEPKAHLVPDLNGYTTPQLRTAVAAYGFKAVKKREDMIRLLVQCQESQRLLKQGLVMSQAEPTKPPCEDIGKVIGPPSVKRKGRPPKDVSVVADQATPQRKPRGRPKKASSDADLTSKLEKASVSRKSKQAKQLERPQQSDVSRKSDGAADEDAVRHAEDQNYSKATKKTKVVLSEHLAKAIGKAISAQPPTHNMRNLSWHETFMLYDPIIIEDLMAWLNVDGLSGIGEDETVNFFQVKEWCEGRSICCLSKENLKGGSKARW